MLSSRDIQARVEEFAWLQWGALGAGGSDNWPRDVLIDPEILVCTTAWATDETSRVRATATDWIRTNSNYLSWTRRKSIAADLDDEGVNTLNLIWPRFSTSSTERARRIAPKAIPLPDLRDRADLLSLRARGMFGIGARAEILRLMVLLPHREWPVARLAKRIGYAKRSVAEALSMLERAGLVARIAEGNALRYRLARTSELQELLRPLPEHSSGGPNWPAIMRIQLALRDIARCYEQLSQSVAQVESATIRERIRGDLIGEWFAGATIERIAPNTGDVEWLEHWVGQLTNVALFRPSDRT